MDKIKFTSDNTESYNQPFTLTELQNSLSKSNSGPRSRWNSLHPPQRTPNNIPKISSRYTQQYLGLWQHPYRMESSHSYPKKAKVFLKPYQLQTYSFNKLHIKILERMINLRLTIPRIQQPPFKPTNRL